MENLIPYLTSLAPQVIEVYQSAAGHWPAAATTGFVLIFAAEMGDKSQLVCMILATRHPPLPVFCGAVLAFMLLNTLAVIFGANISAWIPDYMVAAAVAILFAVFGFQTLLVKDDDLHSENVPEKSGRSIFFSTFLLITIAEFGDKTQLAVVALSTTSNPVGVWVGSTLALACTSLLGIVAGRTVLQSIPLTLLHRISGLVFLGLAGYAGYNAFAIINASN